MIDQLAQLLVSIPDQSPFVTNTIASLCALAIAAVGAKRPDDGTALGERGPALLVAIAALVFFGYPTTVALRPHMTNPALPVGIIGIGLLLYISYLGLLDLGADRQQVNAR